MCPNHHTVIDADEEAYTVERILRMKADHEARVDAMTEEDAEQIAKSVSEQNFSNIGQTGGIAAQNIHAQTFNFHHAVANDPAMQRRRIMAVEKLWTALSSLKKEFGDLIFVEKVLTSAEIDGFFKNGWPQQLSGIKTYASSQAIVTKLANATGDAELERPFVSYKLWGLYFVSTGLYGRFALLFEKSFKRRCYQNWQHDSGTDQLLRSVLPESTVNNIKSMDFHGLTTALDCLENQFLIEANMQGQSH